MLRSLLPWIFVAVGFIVIIGLVRREERTDVAYQERIALLRHEVAARDTVYVRDTLRLAPARARYRSARDSLRAALATDSCVPRGLVDTVLAQADMVIALDSVALGAARDAIVTRDSLIGVLSHPPVRRFLPSVSVLYNTPGQYIVFRGELEIKIAKGFSLVGQAEYGHAGGIGIGIKKTF